MRVEAHARLHEALLRVAEDARERRSLSLRSSSRSTSSSRSRVPDNVELVDLAVLDACGPEVDAVLARSRLQAFSPCAEFSPSASAITALLAALPR